MATQLTLNDGSLNSAGALALKTNGTTQAINITTGQQVEFNAGSASAPSVTATGDSNTGIFFPAADTVGITTGGTERARVDSSGNLGIGVTPSAWSGAGFKVIDILGGASFAGSTAAASMLQNTYYNGSSYTYKGNDYATRYVQNSGVHYWYNAPSGTAGNAITFTQAMTLDASGNLGVGTTSPTDTLGYGRAVDIQSTAGASVYLRDSDATSEYFSVAYEGGTAKAANLYNSAAGPMKFYTSATERARIDSSGNLLVGVTSGAGKLTVEGNGASNYTASFANTVTNNNVLLVSGTSSSNAQNYVVFAKSGTVTGTIYFNGSTVAYNTTSDYRLKEDVAPVNGSLARIASLNPIEFTWRNNGIRSRGFLAHNFQEVYPQSVNGAKDAIDEKGKPVYQTMQASTSEVIADLVACIQEQQAIIEGLTARITALEQA